MSEPSKVTFGSIMGWLFGVLFLLAGIGLTITQPKFGIWYLLASAFCLPPIAAWMEQKSNIQMSGGARAIAAVVLVFMAPFVAMSGKGNEPAAGPVVRDNNAPAVAGMASPPASPSSASEMEVPTIEIVSIKTKAVEKNSVWTKYAYVVTLKNNTGESLSPRVKVKWVDAEDFVLEDKTVRDIVVAPHETATFNGYDLIDAGPARKVAGVTAELARF